MPDLSEQELRLMRLLVSGAKNRRVAQEFGVSLRTIESKRQQVMLKLGAKSPTQLGYHFAKWETRLPLHWP